jgi:hypothetical protein
VQNDELHNSYPFTAGEVLKTDVLWLPGKQFQIE